jgi:hypothetical protein
MAKMKSDKQLLEIAETIIRSNPAPSMIEDGISICSYVARTLGIELTIAEVDKVEKFMDELNETNEQRERFAKMAIDAIVIVDCSDENSMSINTVKVFPNNAFGIEAANATFAEWVNEVRGDNEDEPLSKEEMQQAIDDGIYRIGSGFIMMISSS